MSRREKPPTDGSCHICNLPAYGFHFGAFSCRPCASFFRRAVMSSKRRQHKCTRGGHCEINESNRCCKSCRYQKCLAMGMSPSGVQPSRDPLGPKQSQHKNSKKQNSTVSSRSIKTEPSGSTGSPSLWTPSPQAMHPFELPPGLPIDDPKLRVLGRMYTTFKEYERSERALYALLFPELANGPMEYRNTTHTDFIKLERGCVPLMLAMVQQWLPSIIELEHESKWKLIRNFFPHFTPTTKVFRTSIAFPDKNDQRIALAFNMSVDSNIDRIHEHFKDNENPSEAIKHSRVFHAKARSLSQKLVELNVRKAELVAMLGLELANEMEMLLGASEEVSDFRTAICSDLHLLIERETKSAAVAATRIGSLICLLYDVNLLRMQISEAVTLLKLFSPHKSELFDDY
ncbi:Nuclear hormone receptor family member nhr-28 [Aphelenchoides fujianensis]|nr:Nuclear hormone receptor family member nhr-28 [Aphelenchoides fujianensis]